MVGFAELPSWMECEKGDWVSLGFELDGHAGGHVTMHEILADGRVVTSVRLESGDDLFLARNGDEWEGRMFPRAGRVAWRIRGDAEGARIESFQREALICSWEGRDGVVVEGLPPALGPFPEAAPTLNLIQEITPILNSLPGANGVIYLDFDGETVSSTQWNLSYTGGSPIVAGSPNFTNTQIETIWKGVSEDYRPFNVTVTTDRSVYQSYPINRRAMMIFTPDNEWYGTAGGVAYVDVFGSATFDAPGWVFTDQLGNVADYCAEAASHEAGHMLGLRHDGTSTLDYYQGHGSGATSWAPIMGVGYYSTVTQWSKGEYPDANRFEDDLAIITSSRNGLGYLGDDHSASTGGATPLTVVGTDQVEASGLIERGTDVDMFSFQTGGGAISIAVNNAAYDPNLDIKVRLLNGGGSEMAVSDSAGTLDASLSLSVVAGTYFLEVSGVGQGDLVTGYSDYGSLGGYDISGTVPLNLELAAEIVSPSAEAISLTLGSGLLLEGVATGGSASWEVMAVPSGESVALSTPNDSATEAVFTGVGTYVLRLKSSGTGTEVVDDVMVSVEASGVTPLYADRAPEVELGRNRTVYGDRLLLSPVVVDDSSPSLRAYEWSILSGNGQLSSTTIEGPELSFPTASATSLRLVVSDGVSRTFDEVTLTANFRVESLIGINATAKAWVAVDGSLGEGWKGRLFAESGWLSGPLGVGYDAVSGPSSRRIFAPLISSALDVESAMYKKRAGCFLRVPFDVVDPGGILSLRLRMKFDDGFVAYLNGVEVARSNVSAGVPAWDAVASSDRRDEDALSSVNYELTVEAGVLVSGSNILAVHGLNSGTGNNERTFILVPELEATLTETPYFAAVSGISNELLRDPAADADGDGRPNLYEHGAGTSPTSKDEGYSMVESSSTITTALVLPSPPPDDVLYVLEYSTTMSAPWSELAIRTGSGDWTGRRPISATPLVGGREKLSFNTPDGTRGFFRLRMELVTP